MTKFPQLFKPFDVPPVHLKNKITMAPLFTAYANGDGTVSKLTIDHYRNLARGGAGMIVVANAAVDLNGILSRYSLRVDDQRFLPGLKQLAQTIRKEGAAAVLQINHGGRFASGDTIYGPSTVSITDINIGGFYKTALKSQNFRRLWDVLTDIFQQRAQRLTEMTDSDIRTIIKAYAEAAVLAKKAGFDMVEIHGGTGYLPVQFLSQRTNKRKDKYGGSLKNRMRFPMELTQEVKNAVGPDFPVGYRFLADEWLRGGFSLDEAKIFAKALSELQIAYLSVTGGTYESFFEPEVIEMSNEPGYMVYLAEQIKRQVHLPVIATGRITEPRLAEEILVNKRADLIGLARPLLSDSQWPQKAQAGEEDSIVLCENCGTCFQLILTDRPVLCSKWDKTEMIRRKSMSKKVRAPHTKILLAVDGSEDSVMGASYAANLLANRKDITAKILHIQTEESIKNEKEVKEMMDLAQSFLLEAGIPKEMITAQVRKKRAGVARDIIYEIKKGTYDTVILGRRGISRARQFLFGSVSRKVLQSANDCTIWVVD